MACSRASRQYQEKLSPALDEDDALDELPPAKEPALRTRAAYARLSWEELKYSSLEFCLRKYQFSEDGHMPSGLALTSIRHCT